MSCQFWACSTRQPATYEVETRTDVIEACEDCAWGYVHTNRVTRISDGVRVWADDDALVAWCEEHDDCRACGELGAACAALPRPPRVPHDMALTTPPRAA